MKVEWYAAFVTLVCLSVWLRGRVLDSVIAVLFFSLFGGGAAFIVAGSSIQPSEVALIFLLAHLLLSMFRRTSHVLAGLQSNSLLAFYCIYSALTAFILPRLFAKLVSLPPMQSSFTTNIDYTVPLHFSNQNVTTAFYLVATLIASVCGGAAAADPKSRRALVNWTVSLAWIHVAFGVAGVVATRVGGAAIIAFFRNAKYAQLTQSEGNGLVRIDGIFPEPSIYAGYAFPFLVLMTELWLRDVRPRSTGLTAAALLLMLLASTSSTAYFAVGVYAVVLLARGAALPGASRPSKTLQIALLGLCGTFVVLSLVAFVPKITTMAARLFQKLTVHKLETLSGRQRLFWARAGVTAFKASWGLGVGAGSFRSSSLLTAILGSSGIVGAVAFAGHLARILRPAATETYSLPGAPDRAVGVSAAWAACAGLLPAMVTYPNSDPGLLFGVFGGLALGWRGEPSVGRVRAQVPARPVTASRGLVIAEPGPER